MGKYPIHELQMTLTEQIVDKQDKRDRLSLLLELLRATEEPVKKTHLLYKARINYYQLTRLVTLLLKLEMIRPIVEPFEGYAITEKGRMLLKLLPNV